MNSGDLTKLQPEVIKQDKVHIYSLHSEAGYYECSVSFLRWICKEHISLTYRFCSWEEYRERPSCKDYMPAGPLLDIAVTTGKLEEMYLPHWIDYDSTMSDMFAALHVDSCGDFVEQVSEVTSSHIKLCQPTFTPWGAMILMKLGFRVNVYRDILIYKTNNEFLTLHVYLVPPDRHLQKEVKETETSLGSTIIQKPNPEMSLQMEDHFFLTADMDTAEISPKKLQLTSERRNFFEVFIRNAENDFCLKLESEQTKNVIWTSTIRKGDYQKQSTDHEQASDQHFVDRHRIALITRVSDTESILDRLRQRDLISEETYNDVTALTTKQKQMRNIFRVCTTRYAKDALLDILKGMKSMKALLRDLEETE
ncbi:NACHT, LRR and PYD domains-containing protein 1b allele 2-like [Larimichthys crocea]|uniref:NACHT, LRR and PYD domains-containing protein 1b allele 2-like n=1 Tax=Larimichthys crocea TaxID=215358 RepID=UPI000F5D4EBE|nr:NACHT, LRR and PYD domains-containing protein 1b allele 2-like [Larimichthys crocea]